MDKSEFIKQALKTVREKHSRNLNATDMERRCNRFLPWPPRNCLPAGKCPCPTWAS